MKISVKGLAEKIERRSLFAAQDNKIEHDPDLSRKLKTFPLACR